MTDVPRDPTLDLPAIADRERTAGLAPPMATIQPPSYPSATATNVWPCPGCGGRFGHLSACPLLQGRQSSRQQEREAADKEPAPGSVEQRLDQAENALMAARRELTNALDWVSKALHEVRQAGRK